jgi:Cu-Zn family superoxide dismutase
MFRNFAATLGTVVLLATAMPAMAAESASAEMKNPEGESVGTVTLQQTPHGTLVHAKLMNLPAGSHAFHIHAIGKCEAPFKSAGGHFNGTGRKHGILNEAGKHAGDMPNVHVPSSGALEIEVLADAVNLDDQLFDADGAAIVIHQGADDYTSDPAGAAGPRIACGVILK